MMIRAELRSGCLAGSRLGLAGRRLRCGGIAVARPAGGKRVGARSTAIARRVDAGRVRIVAPHVNESRPHERRRRSSRTQAARSHACAATRCHRGPRRARPGSRRRARRGAAAAADGGRSPSTQGGRAARRRPRRRGQPERLGEREGLVDAVDRARPGRRRRAGRRPSARRARVAGGGLERSASASTCSTRAVLVAKRSSAGRSGSPSASHRRANSRSLPAAIASGRSAAS